MINDNTSILHPTHYYYKPIQHLYKCKIHQRRLKRYRKANNKSGAWFEEN